MINIFKISNKYLIKKLNENDVNDILNLENKNLNYYKFHPPLPTKNSVIIELNALPINKSNNDKYFIGYYFNNKLIAIMDLIDNYPIKKCAFIGLFMIDIDYQNKGIGTAIINELSNYLMNNQYQKIRIGIDENNMISNNFWKKNNFIIIDKKIIDNYPILVAEKNI